MIIWGGITSDFQNTGGRYNPQTDSWTSTPILNAPSARQFHTMVWTGSEMIVWGGSNGASALSSGARYDPATDFWTATSTANAPFAKQKHSAVWAGSEMIVWAGQPYDTTGGRYNPSLNSWTATAATNAPSIRASHSAVWTAGLPTPVMIVWGGAAGDSYDIKGGRYNPKTDSWTPTSTVNAPPARKYHTAVWTGTEMIIWGGYYYDGNYNFPVIGGRYNPAADSWTLISTTNSPSGRYAHTAVWAGSEMIVWGGYFYDGAVNFFHTGGRYNPLADSWTATATAHAPSERQYHTAVWTGTEMIIWGGGYAGTYYNTGGRYNPERQLAEGIRQFEVRAYDQTGNVDPTPAFYSWTIDVP